MLTKFILCFVFLYISGIGQVMAVSDPLSVPNNRFGVHILETSELSDAAKLVNSSGGDWGYVTIPMRIDDRNRAKWTEFFNNCSEFHLIPIIRLAAFANTDKWIAPTAYDLVDFANFLSDMPWPVKNRYVVLFNEPNHSKEWGGILSPRDYASLLVTARNIFKSRSDNYFLISAGLDMSAPSNLTSMDALNFYHRMTLARPDWFTAVDGLAFHAYPNPAFLSSPYSSSRYGISSYKFELLYLSRLGFSKKPIFITETGFLGQGDFFSPAFTQIWTDANIVAITPFILFAGAGDFLPFSLLDPAGKPTSAYQTIQKLPKVKGSPLLINTETMPPGPAVPDSGSPTLQPNIFQRIFKLFFPGHDFIKIGETDFQVEIADSENSRIRGLSGRTTLTENTGMLFKYPSASTFPFRMTGMNFSLDIIWINNQKVVALSENVLPPAETNDVPISVSPSLPSDWVVEVNAGSIKKYNIKIGDLVETYTR